MSASFAQTSDSAVFGKLQRKGTLRLAKGSRLRLAYADGLELVSDGRSLIQYDPDTRTAQVMNLQDAASEAPLLRLLTNPATLQGAYLVERAKGDQVHLKPLKPGLPEVWIEGSGRLPRRLRWTDASGAGQVLDVQNALTPAKDFPVGTFTFKAPKGTRWLGK